MSNVITDDQARANIAANVARLRAGRTLSRLAEECGTYPANIQRIEEGRSLPGAGLLARLADALGTSTDALLARMQPRPANGC